MTPGYAALMAEIRMDDIKYDPWGTAIGWLFGIAQTVFLRFDDILPGFRPVPLAQTDPDGPEEEFLFHALDSGQLTEADLRRAFANLTRFDEWCRIAGRNY